MLLIAIIENAFLHSSQNKCKKYSVLVPGQKCVRNRVNEEEEKEGLLIR